MISFVSVYDRELRENQPGIADIEVERVRDRQFANWIKDKVRH